MCQPNPCRAAWARQPTVPHLVIEKGAEPFGLGEYVSTDTWALERREMTPQAKSAQRRPPCCGSRSRASIAGCTGISRASASSDILEAKKQRARLVVWQTRKLFWPVSGSLSLPANYRCSNQCCRGVQMVSSVFGVCLSVPPDCSICRPRLLAVALAEANRPVEASLAWCLLPHDAGDVAVLPAVTPASPVCGRCQPPAQAPLPAAELAAAHSTPSHMSHGATVADGASRRSRGDAGIAGWKGVPAKAQVAVCRSAEPVHRAGWRVARTASPVLAGCLWRQFCWFQGGRSRALQ